MSQAFGLAVASNALKLSKKALNRRFPGRSFLLYEVAETSLRFPSGDTWAAPRRGSQRSAPSPPFPYSRRNIGSFVAPVHAQIVRLGGIGAVDGSPADSPGILPLRICPVCLHYARPISNGGDRCLSVERNALSSTPDGYR